MRVGVVGKEDVKRAGARGGWRGRVTCTVESVSMRFSTVNFPSLSPRLSSSSDVSDDTHADEIHMTRIKCEKDDAPFEGEGDGRWKPSWRILGWLALLIALNDGEKKAMAADRPRVCVLTL